MHQRLALPRSRVTRLGDAPKGAGIERLGGYSHGCTTPAVIAAEAKPGSNAETEVCGTGDIYFTQRGRERGGYAHGIAVRRARQGLPGFRKESGSFVCCCPFEKRRQKLCVELSDTPAIAPV